MVVTDNNGWYSGPAGGDDACGGAASGLLPQKGNCYWRKGMMEPKHTTVPAPGGDLEAAAAAMSSFKHPSYLTGVQETSRME